MTNNGEGTVLVELHGREVGLDSSGNLVLNTYGVLPNNPSLGPAEVVGRNIPYTLKISAAKGAANVTNVTFQVQDIYGNALSAVWEFTLYLSDAATGIGLTATTASGGIAAAASGGTVIGVLTTAKALRVSTNASGAFVLAITDTAKTGFYPVGNFPHDTPVTVGAQLVAANYGP